MTLSRSACTWVWLCLALMLWFSGIGVAENRWSASTLGVFVDPGATNASTCFVFDAALGNYTLSCGVLPVCKCKTIVGAVQTSSLLLGMDVSDLLSVSVCTAGAECDTRELAWSNFTSAEVMLAPGLYQGECNTEVKVSGAPISFLGLAEGVVIAGEDAVPQFAFRFDGVGSVQVSSITLRSFSSPNLFEVIDTHLGLHDVVIDSILAAADTSIVVLDATSSLTAANFSVSRSQLKAIFATDELGGTLNVQGLHVTDCRLGSIGEVTVRDNFTMSNVSFEGVSTVEDAADRRILDVTLRPGVAAVTLDNWRLNDVVLLASSVVFIDTAEEPVLPTVSFSDWHVKNIHGPRSTLVETHGVASYWTRLSISASLFEVVIDVTDGACVIDSANVTTTTCDKGVAVGGRTSLSIHDIHFSGCRTQYGLVFAGNSDSSSHVEVANSLFDTAGPAILTHDGSTIVRDSIFANVNDVAVSLSSADPEEPALLLRCSFMVVGTEIGAVYSDGFAVIDSCDFSSEMSPTAIIFGRQLPDGSDDDLRAVTVLNSTFERACIIGSVSRLYVLGCIFNNPVSTTFVSSGAAHPVNSIFATGNMARLVLANSTIMNANSQYDAQDSNPGVTPSAVELDGKLDFTLEVDVINCTFVNNFAYRGGALLSKNAGLTLVDSLFRGNVGGSGGAIAVEGGTTNIGDVVFQENEALEDGGALWVGIHSSINAGAVAFVGNVAHSSGGGAYFGATSSGTLDRVLFANCSALSGGGLVATGKSNPIVLNSLFSHCTCSSSGGAVSVADYSTAKFYNCTVRENVANSYGAGFHISAFSEPSIVNSTVEANRSPNSGGGIYVQDEAQPVIAGTIVAGNVAESVGGGLMFAVNSSGIVSSCVIVSNTGRSKGGGVALEDFSHPLIEDTLIASNMATSAGGMLAMDSASPLFQNCTFEDNSALSTGGAAVSADFTNVFFFSCSFLRNRAKFSSGGALALSGFTNATFVETTFHENFAHGGGGALFHSSLSPPTITNCSFVRNSVSSNGGGALLLVSASRVHISESNFEGNFCSQGGGGALFSAASNGLQLQNTTFSGNTAIGHGGAVYVGASCVVDVRFAKFELNNSTASGGALYVEHGAIGTISDSVFVSNFAMGGKGGAAFVAATGFIVSRVIFTSNTATYGGALLQQPPLIVSDEVTRYVECTFDNNISVTNGGAVAIEFAAAVGNQTVVPPVPVSSLGRLVCTDSSCFDYTHALEGARRRPRQAADGYAFTSCQFRFNSASQNGGAISMDLLTAASTFYEPLFLGNSAGHFGGAIFAQVGSAVPIVTLGTFSNNVATWAGRNMGFRILENAAAVDQNVCFECLLGDGLGESGYDNSKGFATMPSVIAYAENTTCPTSLTLEAPEFSLSLGLRDDFATKVEGPLLEDTSFVIAYNFSGTNCTVNAPFDSGFQPISGETGVVTFANMTVSGRSNSTCQLLFSSLPVKGLRLPFEQAIQEVCIVALGGCPAGEIVVQGDSEDSCEEESTVSNNLVHIMVAVIFGLLLIVLMLFLCNVALQYQEHKKRAKKAYYAALEIDDEFLVPGMVTLEDVINDPEITRIPIEDVTVGKRIGFGASGVVSSAVWHRTDGDCQVAMKELLFHLSDLDGAAIHEFLVEIKLMSALHHRNVVRFLGIVYHEDRLYLVTELMQYGCLRELLTKKGSNLSWRLKMKLLIDAAKGMRYLHSKNLIHRDLKPQNLLVNSFWKCKIADFGISTVMTRTRTLTAVGTPVYMAPEVLNNERYSQKADVYSFGIVAAEVFSGERPYAEHGTLNDAQLLYRIYHDNLRPNVERLPHLLAELVRESVDQNPDMRPSFGEIVERLKRLKGLELSTNWEPADQGWESEASAPEERGDVVIIVPSDGELATSFESDDGFLLGATPDHTSRGFARGTGSGELFNTNGSINGGILE